MPLSQRQRAVLSLLATGLTSGEVANVLRASEDEVCADFLEAMEVLGARSKLEAVMIAFRDGLIHLPPGPRPVPAPRDPPDDKGRESPS